MHDGIGIWLAARRLHQGHFVWPSVTAGVQASLSRACMAIAPESLSSLSAQELREIVTGLMERITERDGQITQRDETIACKDREILYRPTKIDQLTHEMAVLKRWKFGKSGEQLAPAQLSLLDEALDADIAAIELELERFAPTPRADTQAGQPKRLRLPPALPRAAAARSNVLGKTSARSGTTRPACSQSSAISAASGPAPSARA